MQRYLDRIRAEHAGVTDGALACYIPELAAVDPGGFALSLSSSDGFIYVSGYAGVEFTIQSISKPFTYALALDRIGASAVDARIGVEPSGEAFNEISVDRATKTPKNPMINAGAIAAVSLIPASGPDDAVVKRTLSVMVTCGMYDAAGDWVSAVGMPAKSGVGGGIVAVLPGQLGIGVYSPLLDEKGNSCAECGCAAACPSNWACTF